MNALLEQFVIESRELLHECNDTFLELEKSPTSPELLNALFRYVHTIKGASGLFEISALTELVHVAEDALSRAREQKIVIDAASIDVFFRVLDQVNDWLDILDEQESLPSCAAAKSGVLVKAIKEEILNTTINDNNDEGKGTVDLTTNHRTPLQLITEAFPHIDDEIVNQLNAQLTTCSENHYFVLYKPEEQAFFSGDDPLNFWRQVPGISWQRILPLFNHSLAESSSLTDFDPYLCQMLFVGITDQPVSVIENSLQYVMDNVEIVPATRSQKGSEHSRSVGGSDCPSEFVEILKAQLEVLRQLPEGNGSLTTVNSVRNVLSGIAVAIPEVVLPIPEAEVESVSSEFLQSLNAAISKVQNIHTQNSSRQIDSAMSYISALMVTDSNSHPAGKGTFDNVSELSEQGASRKKNEEIKTIKVDQERLEQLVDLAGELIVAKNSMQHLARRVEQEYGIKALSRDLKSEHAVLNRITESLQGVVMRIRMIPVSTIFQRFPRLVRDLSRKLDKEIELVIEGEDTEADKNIVEQLAEPLIHLVRNSIDHGIELPNERQAHGKRAAGTIRLVAKNYEDSVHIEIHDDGKGIDVEKVKQKAIEKGLISQEQAAHIENKDAYNLIFEPGFSTCDQVSDLSGRGVGMDVVKTSVSRVGGVISLDSEPGQGTVIRVSLPASITVTRVMMFEIAGQVYGIPVEGVVETIKIGAERIRTIKTGEAYVLRNQLIPLHRMERVLHVHSQIESEDIPVINLNLNGQVVGFMVDKLLEGVDVIIKPLDGVMARFPIYSGAAVLGDGRVLLVINPKEVALCL